MSCVAAVMCRFYDEKVLKMRFDFKKQHFHTVKDAWTSVV